MKLVTFRHGGSGAQAGVVSGNKVTAIGLDMMTVLFADGITSSRRRILRSEFRNSACAGAAPPEVYLRGAELSRSRD